MDKSSSLGMPMAPQEIFKRYKRQSLGMPRSIPIFITKVSGHFSMRLFLLLLMICVILGASLFLFSVLFCFVLSNKWLDPIIFVLEKTHSVLIA